jgi:hypothetical protein
MTYYFKTLRPWQWLKNTLIFIPYILKFSMSGNLEDFSGEIFKNKILLILSSIILISFCLGYFVV